MTTPLGKVSQLAPVRKKLEALGYENLEGVRELDHIGAPELVERYLGRSLKELLAKIPVKRGGKKGGAKKALPPEKRFTGVDIKRIPPPIGGYAKVAVPAGGLPDRVDLRASLRSADVQGERRTCVAFAACAVLESASNRRTGVAPAKGPRYSPQHLYWSCKEHDDLDFDGTFLEIAFQRLRDDGTCIESKWPYVYTRPKTAPYGEGPPPAVAIAAPRDVVVQDYLQLDPRHVETIRAQLATGLCVAVTIPVFPTWNQSSEVHRSGALVLPLPDEEMKDGHAVCLVGYRTDPTRPGGGEFILRNSWGGSWPHDPAVSPGYGKLPFQYIADHGREAYSVLA